MSPLALRLTLAAAAVLALAGVVLRVLPPVLPEAPAAAPDSLAPVAPSVGSERAAAVLAYREIVEANPFSPERAAPADRYTPPELAGVDGTGPVAPAPQPARPSPPPMRLVGTAVGAGGGVALIEADPSVPGAEVYRPGDRVGTARLVEIRETAVVLDGPDGRITLTLPRTVRRSP